LIIFRSYALTADLSGFDIITIKIALSGDIQNSHANTSAAQSSKKIQFELGSTTNAAAPTDLPSGADTHAKGIPSLFFEFMGVP
jgi:hypothetical protein